MPISLLHCLIDKYRNTHNVLSISYKWTARLEAICKPQRWVPNCTSCMWHARGTIRDSPLWPQMLRKCRAKCVGGSAEWKLLIAAARTRGHGAFWCLKTYASGVGVTTRWNQSVNAYTIALHQRRRRAMKLLKETQSSVPDCIEASFYLTEEGTRELQLWTCLLTPPSCLAQTNSWFYSKNSIKHTTNSAGRKVQLNQGKDGSTNNHGDGISLDV
jgi:hypothetical protein